MRIKVKTKPNSEKQKVSKKSGNFFYASVKAPPKDGKANDELVEVLADYFDVPQANIEIASGRKGPIKYVDVETDGE